MPVPGAPSAFHPGTVQPALQVAYSEIDNLSEGNGNAGGAYTNQSGITDSGGNSGATWNYDAAVFVVGSGMGSLLDLSSLNANRLANLAGIPTAGTNVAFGVLTFSLSAWPTTNNTTLFNMRGNAAQQAAIATTTTNHLAMRDASTTRYTSTLTLTPGPVYTIGLGVDTVAQKFYMRIWDVGGALLEDSGPQTYTNGTVVDSVNMGLITNPGNAVRMYVPYWGYSTIDWVGPPVIRYDPTVAVRPGQTYSERRQTVAQRALVSDPSLLLTAELENELLGGADYARHATWFTDRREVPQQPARLADPVLITTALTEGPNLRQDPNQRAWYADRRQVPQQPARLADPVLITTALTEGPNLRPDPNQRAWYIDRRQVPAQPARLPDPTLGVVAGFDVPLLREDPNQRAWYPDRRLYPTQPLRPADPLLIQTALTEDVNLRPDPNQRAWYTDRRLAPQQPARLADPLLITTALLESPLLRAPLDHAVWFTDRRLYPAQPLRLADPALILTALLESPLLRPYVAPWYPDRREVPQQPARQAWTLEQALLESPLQVALRPPWVRPGWSPQQRALYPVPAAAAGAQFDPTLGGLPVRYVLWTRVHFPTENAQRPGVPVLVHVALLSHGLMDILWG